MNYQCVVCGEVIHTSLTDHRDQAHPGIKTTIPIRDLYREEPTP